MKRCIEIRAAFCSEDSRLFVQDHVTGRTARTSAVMRGQFDLLWP